MGLARSNLIAIANQVLTPELSTLGFKLDADPKETSFVRLMPCLWQEGGAMDYWLHFLTERDLKEAYKDILDKLLEFGIPFLNDPNSSFEIWYERGTG
jgi:hypothetical protein